jgi:hypothetical protein
MFGEARAAVYIADLAVANAGLRIEPGVRWAL